MSISVKYALRLLTLATVLPLLAGCDHKTQQAQNQPLAPPIVDAPPPKPAPVSPAELPPPVIGEPQPKPGDKTTPAQWRDDLEAFLTTTTQDTWL